LLATISAELHGSNSEFEKEIMRVYNKWTRFLERLIEEGKTQRVFSSELDTHTLAHVLAALNDGILLGFSRNRDLLDGKRYVRTFRQVLFHGVKPHSGAKKPVPNSDI
jgi:hypothetical protein